MGKTFVVSVLFFSLGAIAGFGADVCPLAPVAGSSSPRLSSTLGIEVEGTWPKEKSLESLRQIIADYLRSNPDVSEVKFFTTYPSGNLIRRLKMRYFHLLGFDTRDYAVSFKVGSEDYRFVFGKDFSIRPPLGRRGVELRSPILRTQRDREIFEGIVTHLSQAGFEASPLSSGLHVHVGMGDASPREIADLVEDFTRVENDVLAFFKVYEKRRYYTRPIAETLKKLVRRPNENLSVQSLQDASDGRYRTLNLMSLSRFGTAEFRFGNSTVDRETISFMADFCLRFVEASRTRRAALDEILAKGDASENFPALLEFLKLPPRGRHQAITQRMLADLETAHRKEYQRMSPANHLIVRAIGGPAIGIAALGAALARLFQSDEDPPTVEPEDDAKNE